MGSGKRSDPIRYRLAMARRLLGRRVRGRLTLVVGGLLSGLLLAECAARATLPAPWYDRLHVASADPLLGLDLRPGQDFSFEGSWVRIPRTRVRISEQGLRDERIDIPKPKGTRRLLCLGDSWTFGWGVEREDSFCSRLSGLLGGGWETVNLGVPGQNSSQEVRRLELQGLQYEPDLVLVQHNVGDLERPLDSSTLNTGGAALVSRVALARLLLHAGHSLGAGGGAGDGEPHDSIPWDGEAESRVAFARLAELGRIHHFESIVFTTAPNLTGLTAALDDSGIVYASLGPALDGPAEELFIPEDGHWTAEGHRRVAELMAATLRETGLVR